MTNWHFATVNITPSDITAPFNQPQFILTRTPTFIILLLCLLFLTCTLYLLLSLWSKMQRFLNYRSSIQSEKDRVMTRANETFRFPPSPEASASNDNGEVKSPSSPANDNTRGTVDNSPLPRSTTITAALEHNRLGSDKEFTSQLPNHPPRSKIQAKSPNNSPEQREVSTPNLSPILSPRPTTATTQLGKISYTTEEDESNHRQREKELVDDIRAHSANKDTTSEHRNTPSNRSGRYSLNSAVRRVRFSESTTEVTPNGEFEADSSDSDSSESNPSISQPRSYRPPPPPRPTLPRPTSFRVHSDLMNSSSLSQRRQENSTRHTPNSRRKRSEVIKSAITNSFQARVRELWCPKPETHPEGVKAALLYLPDSENDGRAKSGLRGTKLAGMDLLHDEESVIRRDMPFTVRVVGTHLGGAAKKAQIRVCFSEVTVQGWGGNEEKMTFNGNHAPRIGAGDGYKPIPYERSLIVDATGMEEDGHNEEVRMLSMHVVLGDVKKRSMISPEHEPIPVLQKVLKEGNQYVNRDITWEISAPGETRLRRGAIPLRYGYYFILGEASELRLYCQAMTPEHMRLVAMSQTDNGVGKKELGKVTRNLSYVVVCISEV